MPIVTRVIKLPNGDLATLTSTSGVELVDGRGVIIKEAGHRSCWYREQDVTRATLVRDALVDFVLNIRKADQPDWAVLN